MNNTVLAGLLAGGLLALVFVGYLLIRGRAFVDVLQQDQEMDRVSRKTLFWICLAGFIGAALLWGAIAGLIYGWIDSSQLFTGLAFGLAIMASVLAFATRTPMPYDKVFMNFAVAGVLGIAIPLFVG
jgi:hypothetical protein